MAILAVVLAVLVVSYGSSMRAYVQQRSHIADLRAEIASSSADIAALEKQKKRFTGDSYVADQARARFGWVLPGETAYQVIGKDGKPLQSSDQLADPDQVVRETPVPWWSKQYDSLRRADHPPKKAPTPTGSISSDAR